MILEIISGVIIAGALAYVFWDELKAWAYSAFEYLVDDIIADYIIDSITGGLISIIKIGGGVFKRAKYFRRMTASFTSGGGRFYRPYDEEVSESKLPTEVVSKLGRQGELPVLRMEV